MEIAVFLTTEGGLIDDFEEELLGAGFLEEDPLVT